MTLSGTAKASPEAVQNLFVKEQFLNSCPRDLPAHLCEKPLRTMEEVADAAERFLTAQNRQLYTAQQQPQQNTVKASSEEESTVAKGGKRERLSPGAHYAFRVTGLATEPTNVERETDGVVSSAAR